MRKRIMINRPSKSSVALSKATGIPRLRKEGSAFKARPDDVIINWGCSHYTSQSLVAGRILNPPHLVKIAGSKIASLSAMQEAGVTVPAFTTDRNVAASWLVNGDCVISRAIDNGSSGRGITFVRTINELPHVPLYTKYVPKYDEYRVHVFGGSVIDIQQKRRRSGIEANSQVRTASNGWVFCRTNLAPPPEVVAAAVSAVAALSLDFGAVDIGFTRKTRTATVYEVNCAPGLEGTTLANYATVIGGIS